MQSCLAELNAWIAADQGSEEEDAHAPRDDHHVRMLIPESQAQVAP